MVTKKAKTGKARKPVQFYKVVNPRGHHGMKYKVGINTDPAPVPLNEISSCGAGALYFVREEFLLGFSGFGPNIAWVKPVGKYVKDSDGTKYKTHTLDVEKILPAKDAIPLICGNDHRKAFQYYSAFSLEVPVEILEKLSYKELRDHYS